VEPSSDARTHALRAAFAVEFDEQYPRDTIALKEWLGHSRIETTMLYLRRKDKAKAMESTSGLSWGSRLPHQRLVPPAGFEPALPP
jgi:integrase